MQNLATVVSIVFPVLLVLLLGYLSAKKRWLSPAQAEGLKGFVGNFSLPAVVFSILYKLDFNGDMFFIILLIYGVCIAGLLLGRLAVRKNLCSNALLPFLTTGFEAGMMGYALYSMIFGTENLHNMACVALGGDLFVFTLYMLLVKRKTGSGEGSILKDMLHSPVFLALALGAVFGISGLGAFLSETGIGTVLDAVLNFLSAPTSCAILFVVGYGIDLSRTAIKTAGRSALIRLVIMAALCTVTLLLVRLFPTTTSHRIWAVLLLFSLPAPFVLPMFAKGEENLRFASTSLSLSTLISIVFFCIIAAVAIA